MTHIEQDRLSTSIHIDSVNRYVDHSDVIDAVVSDSDGYGKEVILQIGRIDREDCLYLIIEPEAGEQICDEIRECLKEINKEGSNV